MEERKKEQQRKEVKIFLTNGFKYDGIELGQDTIFYKFLDLKDNKEKKIPFTAISLIEPRGEER